MRVISKSTKHFLGTHKGATIDIEKEPDGTFYIIVTGANGGKRYDGWAADDIRTMREAKRDAIHDAAL
jgi:hypothetical protein